MPTDSNTQNYGKCTIIKKNAQYYIIIILIIIRIIDRYNYIN